MLKFVQDIAEDVQQHKAGLTDAMKDEWRENRTHFSALVRLGAGLIEWQRCGINSTELHLY